MKRFFSRLSRDPLARAVTILTLLLSAAIVFDVTPLLRGPAPYPPEWQWHHVWPPDVRPAWLLLPLGVAGLIGLWALLTRNLARLRVWTLLALAGLAFAFWLAVMSIGHHGLQIVARTLNPAYFSVFGAAVRIDNMPEFLRTYVAQHAQLAYRQRSHPPGNTLFFWSIIHVVRGLPFVTRLAAPVIQPRLAGLPGWINSYATPDIVAGIAVSLIVPALNALSILPLYRLARRLSGERAARLAAILYAFVPGMALFLPVVDGTYALIAITAVWLTAGGLADRQRWRIALGGLVGGLGTFMSYSMIPLALMLALVTVFHYTGHYRRPGLKQLALDLLALAAGGLVVWIIPWLLFGFNPIGAFLAAMHSHENSRNRSYWLWLFYNPYDVLLFAGVPVAFHYLRGLLRLGKGMILRVRLGPADWLLAAFVLSMIAMDVSGGLRGETARTLLYVMPLLAWAAAHDIAGENVSPAGYGVLLSGLLVLQTLAFQAALNVYH